MRRSIEVRVASEALIRDEINNHKIIKNGIMRTEAAEAKVGRRKERKEEREAEEKREIMLQERVVRRKAKKEKDAAEHFPCLGGANCCASSGRHNLSIGRGYCCESYSTK